MASFKIVQKKNHNKLYASGFHSLERAQVWLDNYNPRNWIDKTIMREDLEIVEEKGFTS